MLNAFQIHLLQVLATARSNGWPPHRPTGTPPKNRKGPNAVRLRMTVKHGRIEMEHRSKLVGGKGLR